MLLSTKELLDIPVMSLQTGTEIAATSDPIIDRGTLHILAYELYGPQLNDTPSFLRVEDIRELSDIGFIVDSSDTLTVLDDIVIDLKDYTDPLHLEGMKVLDTHGVTLGKVEAIIMSTATFSVEQLQIKQPLLRRLSETNLLIKRSQIIDITDDHILVQAADIKAEHETKLTNRQSLLQAIRRPAAPRPESAKSDTR